MTSRTALTWSSATTAATGLSAGNLNIEDSTVTASNNGLTGITFTGKGSITDSTVTVTGTKGLTNSHRYGYNAGLRLGSSSATLDIKNSTVTVADQLYKWHPLPEG